MKIQSVKRSVQNTSASRIISLFVLISFSFTVSCTTNKVHPIHTTLPQEQARDIKQGDTVKVTTHSGERYKFKVENISNEAIEGEGIKLAFAEVDSIKKVRITGKRVAIVVGIIALIAGLLFLASKSDYQSRKHYGTVNTSQGGGK